MTRARTRRCAGRRLLRGGLVLLPLLASVAVAAPKLTLYDDGRACPASCDAHVVFHPSLNGTRHARAPGSAPDAPRACVRDAPCEICFDAAATECLVVPYRGSGPGRDTFDLTPAFYETWCAQTGIPARLAAKCAELRSMASRLDGRVNCIGDPAHPSCAALMEAAKEAKAADTPIHLECGRVGQSAFNEGRPPAERRAHGCGYEFESTGGPNSNGLRWKKLLPGACREGTFVGRDGLDCCSGRAFVDAALGLECRIYYPRENE